MPATQLQYSPDIFGLFDAAMDYHGRCPAHRVVLGVMRQRGDQSREHLGETVPHMLSYDAELIIVGERCGAR